MKITIYDEKTKRIKYIITLQLDPNIPFMISSLVNDELDHVEIVRDIDFSLDNSNLEFISYDPKLKEIHFKKNNKQLQLTMNSIDNKYTSRIITKDKYDDFNLFENFRIDIKYVDQFKLNEMYDFQDGKILHIEKNEECSDRFKSYEYQNSYDLNLVNEVIIISKQNKKIYVLELPMVSDCPGLGFVKPNIILSATAATIKNKLPGDEIIIPLDDCKPSTFTYNNDKVVSNIIVLDEFYNKWCLESAEAWYKQEFGTKMSIIKGIYDI